MSGNLKKLIAVLIMAGILLTPACYNIDEADSLGNQPTSPAETSQTSGNDNATSNPAPGSETDGETIIIDQPKETEGTVDVITNEQELEEYFNSITDEEIEELLRIIEDIDVTDDINPDADPGFDQVKIP